MKITLILLRILLVFLVLTLHFDAFGATPLQSLNWQNKVDPWVLSTAEAGETEFLIFLNEQADLSAAVTMRTKEEKGQFVFEQLTAVAAKTQSPIIEMLREMGVDFRPHWIANMIWARGSKDIVELLAQHPDVAHIYANPKVKNDLPAARPEGETYQDKSEALETVPWNIELVRAPQLWVAGYTGQGVVIGGQDTGYDWEHPALKEQYRGWDTDTETANHNYSWHDAIHEGGGSCGPNSQEPCDDHGHGTHTMGTMVGDDGLGNQIGMAPGARWIGCRNMDEGYGSPSSYSECYEWFLAPTDLNGENPRPDLAPDVINNSWSCPESEGCTDPNVLLTVVDNLRAAGIVTVHSAGNSGSSCSTVNTPAAIYESSFTVGATDSSDNIANFSSRGPVTIDGSGRMKPEISAPGVGILSSTRGGGYGLLSGTSMAAPHVAGLVALLISSNPDLHGDVDTIENVIRQSAVPLTTSQECGGVPGSQVPNNTFGWGRINALNAYFFSAGYDVFHLPVIRLKTTLP